MDLMHNQAISILDGDYKGIYRIILNEPSIDKTCLVRLDPDPVVGGQSKGGRRRLDNPINPRKKQKQQNVGALIWIDRPILEELDNAHLLQHVEIEYRNITPPKHDEKSKRKQAIYERRTAAMEPFLSFVTLRDNILITQDISSLVKLAIKQGGFSKSTIYNLFSKLCRFGFSEKSLNTDFDKCGAPGVPRPCDPEGRKKAGAKTTKQKMADQQGIILDPDQPGMNTEWTNRILAADNTIPTPKPAMPERITQIQNSAFISTYRTNASGALIAVYPELGSYPNKRQIRRVLEREIPRLQRLLEKTTKGHFSRSKRGFRGKSWDGVAGPGHTWAIDSTIGDIYLRSSINRAWIIGRPIVYIVVDVWSTAITGFFVCLRGPSWDMAKLALFCSGADPRLIGTLWGYQPIYNLSPIPTLPADLLCDRGEYLSFGAKQTGIRLLPGESYTPPYRPDLKGLVEVLHRIEKDKLYTFKPGAIDARRAEYELRKFNPYSAVFTLREFVHYLYIIFSQYNFSALRDYRLDSHMKGDGAIGTPAGLWYWGHKMGIGLRREVSHTDLLTELLPSSQASVTRHGVILGGREYQSELVDEQKWTTYARNSGGWRIPANYFPGNVSTIWTPNFGESGLIQLSISDQSTASPELTWDEVLDADKYYAIGNAEREHQRTITNIVAQRAMKDMVDNATRLTQEAENRYIGQKPTATEARELENTLAIPGNFSTQPNVYDTLSTEADEAEEAYYQDLQNFLQSEGKGV